MRARLTLIGLLVAWLWVASAGPALADPITLASAGIAAFKAGTMAAAVASFVVRSAIYSFASWGMSRISRALSRGRGGSQERQATVTTLSIGEVPRELVVGRAVTAGSLIDAFNFGGRHGTDTVVRVIALADHEITQLEGVFVDDAYQGFGFSGVQLGFNGKLDIEFVNAKAAGGAPPARFASAGGWAAADKVVGIAHVWVAYTIDDETWTGHPNFRFLVKGAKLYNPAKDAALGYEGTNPHAWSNPATHEFTENAAVIEYNYRRGIYVTGRHGQAEHLLFGRGLTTEEAPPEAVLPWIALCDESVGGQPRYRAAGVITTDDGHDVVAQWLADAMAGHVVQREGGIEVEPGHAKAPVMTITDGDLVVGEKVVFNAFSPDGSTGRYNTIIPRYVEPQQGWQDHSGPVRRDLADIAEDGGPRELTLPLPLVTWGAQADRCAEIKRRRERLERTASIVLPPRFAALEEGDWIDWQSDRRHGGATVTYQVEEAELGPNWRQYLVLREISADVFDDGDGLDDDADPLTPTPQPDPVYLTEVTVQPMQLSASETGAVQPGLRFGWAVPVDAAIVAIRAEVRLRGATDVAPTTTEAVNAGILPVTQGVLSGSWLEARLVPVTRTNRQVVPSNWVLLRVGQGVSDDLTPTGPGRRRVLWDQLDEARARFDADLEAEGEAEANEGLTRALVGVLAEVNPVSRRALLRAAELDLEGSTLNLFDVTSRTELGLDDFGDVNRPLRPDIITDSGLVVQLELSDAVDGLEGQIGLVAADVVSLTSDLALAETTLQGEIDAVELTVGGHTTELATLTSDLAAAELALGGEIDALETTVGGNTSAIAGLTTTVGGHTTQIGALDADLTGLAGDLAAAETALGADIDAVEIGLATLETDFGVAELKLATIEEGATAGADFAADVANVPANLLLLSGTEVLDNAQLEDELVAGTVVPAEAATFTNKGALAERDDVDTPQIVPLSVTASGRAVTDAQITIGENGAYVQIQSLVITTTGAPVEIDWGAYFRTKSPAGYNIQISLNRSTIPTGGGSPVTAGPDFGAYQALELSGDDFYHGLLASKAKDTPPAGTTTYILSAGSNLGTFLTTKTAEKRYLAAREYKSE